MWAREWEVKYQREADKKNKGKEEKDVVIDKGREKKNIKFILVATVLSYK